MTEGTIPHAGGETWYRLVGDGEEPGKLPLLCLHGGPGALHDYLEPLGALAETGRRVAFYDQIGCGRSWVERDPSFWTFELFVGEVQAEETNRLRRELPAEVQAVLDEHEAAGTLDSPEYEQATMEFYKRHVCRMNPFPDYVLRTFAGLAEHPDVYMHMQGPNEFVVTGTLKDWDISDRLGEIRVPTLITSGAHDEFTPRQAEALNAAIPGSERVAFESSSHMQFAEEPERYVEVVSAFLDRVEQG